MHVLIRYCIYVQSKTKVSLKSVGDREKGNFGNLGTRIDRKALSDKDLRVSVKR